MAVVRLSALLLLEKNILRKRRAPNGLSSASWDCPRHTTSYTRGQRSQFSLTAGPSAGTLLMYHPGVWRSPSSQHCHVYQKRFCAESRTAKHDRHTDWPDHTEILLASEVGKPRTSLSRWLKHASPAAHRLSSSSVDQVRLFHDLARSHVSSHRHA